MAHRPPYSAQYYQKLQEGALQSAREVVPLIIEQVQPRRVIDVGCGLGIWLSVFKERGVEEIVGIDGEWIDRDKLYIPTKYFRAADLERPFRIDESFDLVVSLEVAEHLPARCAEAFVDSLVRLGPIILFSAAAPHQGGTNHVNEQWPNYWVARFRDRGYVVANNVRRKIWHNEQVEWWYRQNMLLFARKDSLGRYPSLAKEREQAVAHILPIVHPASYLSLHEQMTDYRDWVSALQEQASTLQEDVSEYQKWTSALQQQIAELEAVKPGRISLRNVLHALPALVRYTLTKKVHRFFKA